MAKFTILRPPSGHTLRIPTVAGLTINLAFAMQDELYELDNQNLKIVLFDKTVLVFDNLLIAARERENAPQILQPEAPPINTHDLLLDLGASLKEASQAEITVENTMLLFNSSMVNELLASSLDMQEQSWHEDGGEAPAWLHSSYILPTPSNKLPVRYHAQLGHIPRSVRAGEFLTLGLELINPKAPNEPVSALIQPLILYIVFTPGNENYSVYNLIDWDKITVSNNSIIKNEWEHNPQGACLLKMAISPGTIAANEHGKHYLWINLPVFQTYLKGMSCSITLAAAIGNNIREGNLLGGQCTIEPNFAARVLYSAPQSAECFTADNRTMDIQPPNIVIRALNFEQGDVVLITQLLQALGSQATYQLKAQGSHLLLLVGAGEKVFRFLLENVSIESALLNSSFIATDQSPPEWLTYVYLSENYLEANAVAEADMVLTVKSLLNAFLNEDDYLSMQTVLDGIDLNSN